MPRYRALGQRWLQMFACGQSLAGRHRFIAKNRFFGRHRFISGHKFWQAPEESDKNERALYTSDSYYRYRSQPYPQVSIRLFMFTSGLSPAVAAIEVTDKHGSIAPSEADGPQTCDNLPHVHYYKQVILLIGC